MARTFDDVDDNITVPDSALFNIPANTGFTVACWAKSSASATSRRCYSQQGVGGYIVLGTTGTGTGRFQISDGTTDGTAVGGSSILDGVWHHLCGVRETDGTTRMFVDGVEVGSDATGPTGSIAIASDVQFSDTVRPERWPGEIAEVMYWNNTRLSDAKILALARRAGRRTIGEQPTGYWPLFGTGSPEPDYSGNSLNGTVTGAVVAAHAPIAPPFGFDLGWMGAFAAAAARPMFRGS